jgi:FO synthase
MNHTPAFDPNAVLGDISAGLSKKTLPELMAEAERLTLDGFGPLVTYSRKVFIPLSQLCRDVCHYCTFAKTPKKLKQAYLSLDQVREIARAGKAAGCREALFTLGDKPELRYAEAADELREMGYATTLEYLREAARVVFEETGLLPHLNPGLMDDADFVALRPVSASMGLMLETASERLSAKGGPHFGSPDKWPLARIETIEAAGRAKVPFTTGLLIGIGETREERLEALIVIRDLQARFGHIQEVIIQNFCPKPGTKMAHAAALPLDEHLWTIAAARLILGPAMSIQAPPNLQPDALAALVRAGVNDWGGVSPVTPDHVNPEAPWPHLDALALATARAGRHLHERLAIGPQFALAPETWLDPALQTVVRRATDGRGFPVLEDWRPGTGAAVPALSIAGTCPVSPDLAAILDIAAQGERLEEAQIVRLLQADGADAAAVMARADALRRRVSGEAITYVMNRNINYTNICLYRCGFCAFSKGSTKAMRGPAYKLDFAEIARRSAEAVERGATEVCIQAGIHPDYDGNTYLGVLAAVKQAAPNIHIHAFSPLEVTHGAGTLGLSLTDFLSRLKKAGLSTLPGTAAEILDDEVRAIICPDKVNTSEWLEVMRTAHGLGLRTTATIMFGHVDRYDHWARHLLRIRDLQEETGGFTEFVPLPFVHMEAPIWQKGRARSGPSHRESILMHSVARLVFHGLIDNIQASWVKLGSDGAAQALQAGANDLGGILMDESITRAAGGEHGQCFDVAMMEALAARIDRPLLQRTTLYEDVGKQEYA